MKKIKITLIAAAIALLILGGNAYASFPTKQSSKETKSTEQVVSPSESKISNEEISTLKESTSTVDAEKAPLGLDEKWILLILWFFLGGVAAHRWYAKKPVGWNILYILTLGGCGVWAIVDLVNILTDNF